MPDVKKQLFDASQLPQNGGKGNLQIYLLHGIFGEIDNCNGIGEYILEPEAGGTYLKILGCNVLYKGNPNMANVFQLEQAKSNIMKIPRLVIAKSFFYMVAVALRAIFQKKKLVHDVHIVAEEIMYKTVRHVVMPEIRMKKSVVELFRAMQVAVKEEFGIAPETLISSFENPIGADEFRSEQEGVIRDELAAVIIKYMIFFCYIMEYDCAYCFPVQDAFGNVDRRLAKENGEKAFLSVIETLIKRGVRFGDRWTFIMKAMKWFLRIYPPARRIVKRFMQELDLAKVALDQDDYYFTLRRNTYDFMGKTFEERLAEVEEADKRYGNAYVKMNYTNVDPNGTPVGTPQGTPTT